MVSISVAKRKACLRQKRHWARSVSFSSNTNVSFLDYKIGQYKGRYGVLDMVFKIRDHHHRIHRQILRQNDGLILILAQS